ncbi:MAG: recombinase family protein [Candidatus Paceibacterota bacterium]
MKSILFARVSSREQEETGYSLPSQEKLLKEYNNKKGFNVAKNFSISESASGRNQRKTFNEMLEYVKENNIKIIICEKVDRLTRNLKDAVSINEWINKDSGREVHFVKEGCILNRESKSNEKFIWNIKVSVAQYYIDNLSEEVKKGQKEKIAQGWLPTKPPLGYKTIGERGHKIHIIDDEKSFFIIKMFKYYATGNYSLRELSKKMYEEGLRTKMGNKLVKM